MPLAGCQTNALRIYYLLAALDFQRTAVDWKQLINTKESQLFHLAQTLITDAMRRET